MFGGWALGINPITSLRTKSQLFLQGSSPLTLGSTMEGTTEFMMVCSSSTWKSGQDPCQSTEVSADFCHPFPPAMQGHLIAGKPLRDGPT